MKMSNQLELFLILALAIGWGSAIASPLIGRAEGFLFPVMGELELVSFEGDPPPDFRNVWSAKSIKIRDCQFIRIEWNFGERGHSHVEVTSFFKDPPMIREEGYHNWSGLIIDLDPDLVLTNSHADVIHQCHWRPWLTRTAFYTSKEDIDEKELDEDN